MSAEIVTLHKSNFRDPVATLRVIADKIEAGEYGDVSQIAVAIDGDPVEIFGIGPQSEPQSIAMLLHRAFARLAGL